LIWPQKGAKSTKIKIQNLVSVHGFKGSGVQDKKVLGSEFWVQRLKTFDSWLLHENTY
jgi:hypothetical protein